MNKSIIFLLLGWFLLCVGCSDDDNCPGNLPDDTKEDVNQIKHIFLFGFDGWSAHSVENASMPTLKKLMAEGAYTLKNRSVLPSSSAPNWASMFMGVGPEWHGYTHWWSQEPELISVELNHYGMFPGIFGLVRDSLPQMEIGYLFDWKVMNFLVDTLAINYRLNVNKAVDRLTDSAVQYILNSKPDFCAVIYGEPDDTGHQYGWESPEYYSRLSELDSCIHKLVKAIEDAGMLSESVVILASDHGGIDKNHGGLTLEELESPLVFYGAGIKKGKIVAPTVKYDIAPTIAYMFGIEQPAVWVGKPILSVLQ